MLGQTRNFLLLGVIAQTVLGFLWVTVAGYLSDVVGRKNMFMFGCVLMGVFGFVYFALLEYDEPDDHLLRDRESR